MKKIGCCLCLLIIMFSGFCVKANETFLINDERYTIVDVLEDGSYETKNSYESFEDASLAYDKASLNYRNPIIVNQGDILKAKYAVVKFSQEGDCSVNTTYTEDVTNIPGYINSCYGGDGAYLETNEDGTLVKFQISGIIAWTKKENVTIQPIEQANIVSSYKVKDKKLYHQIKTRYSDDLYSSTVYLGKAPSFMENDKEYYSFNGHYFYEKTMDGFHKMIDDDRSQTYANAENSGDVYFNYYQFLPHRTTTSYSNEDIKAYFQENLGLQYTLTSFKDYTFKGIHNVLNDSMLYNEQDAFFQYESQFGANALMMLSLSMNESAVGRSSLAYSRNNLFGHAAFDSDVENNASRYLTIASSISSHAKNYISLAYANPDKYQYHGSYFGNKQSGMNVSYASDPYWGEKAAQYYAEIDAALGNKDLNAYALGLHTANSNMNVYTLASLDSEISYTVKDQDYSVVILQKIVNKDGTWYKIQSEKTEAENGSYDFSSQHGYVKEEDINHVLNEDNIAEKTYETVTFDAKEGLFQNKDSTLTLHIEEGKSPSVVPPIKENAIFKEWKEESTSDEANKSYYATYKDIKSLELVALPKVTYYFDDWLDTNGGLLKVTYADGSKEDITLTSAMVSGYDRKVLGEQTLVIHYGGSSVSYEIEVKEATSDKKELADFFNQLIASLDGKTEITMEEKQSLLDMKDKIDTNSIHYSISDKRSFDNLYQMIDSTTVVIKDNGRNLGVSGLPLSIPKSSLDKRIKISIKDSVSSNMKDKLQDIAKGNEYDVIDYFHMDSNIDSTSLNAPIVISIDKPQDVANNQLFTVLGIHDEAVIRLYTTQSQSKIIFETDFFEDFVIVSKTSDTIVEQNDFIEIHTKEGNPDDTMYYLIIGGISFISIGIVIVCIMRYRNIKQYKKKRAGGHYDG